MLLIRSIVLSYSEHWKYDIAKCLQAAKNIKPQEIIQFRGIIIT